MELGIGSIVATTATMIEAETAAKGLSEGMAALRLSTKGLYAAIAALAGYGLFKVFEHWKDSISEANNCH